MFGADGRDVEYSYNINQINAIRYCIKERVASKSQIETVFLWDEYQHNRSIKNEGMRLGLQERKENNRE